MEHIHEGCDHCHDDSENNNLIILRIILSSIFLILAFFIPASEYIKPILF